MSDGYRFIGGVLCNEDGDEPYQHKIVNERYFCVKCTKESLFRKEHRPDKCPYCGSIAIWPVTPKGDGV